MLDSIRFKKKSWIWIAHGKHPSAKDYFRIGKDLPIFRAFADWMDHGAATLSPGPAPGFYSWRFWARGGPDGAPLCGVARDSGDSLGRSHPLLIMGAGPLKGWPDRWDQASLIFENSWRQIEYLSSRRLMDFKQLEKEVRLISPPAIRSTRGGSSKREGSDPRGAPLSRDPRDIENQIRQLAITKEVIIPLESDVGLDPSTLAGAWHRIIKERPLPPPNAAFIGGPPDKTHLAIFNRPLTPADFVRLWSL